MTIRSTPQMDVEESAALGKDLENRLIASARADRPITISGQDALMLMEHIKMALAWTAFISHNEGTYPDVDRAVGMMFKARIESAFPGYPNQIVRQ